MQSNTANVIGFDNGSIYQSILTFLNDDKSESTKVAYKKDLETFFMYVCKKDMSTLTEDDLINIKNETVKKFRNHLKDKGKSPSSINRCIRAASSLFKALSVDRPLINPGKLKVKPLHEPKNGYGDFTQDEIEQMIDYVRENKANGEEKALLIELAIKTAYRQNYLLSLTWKHIKRHNDEYYIIKGNDSAHKIEEDKTIEKELYNRLLTLKKDNTDTIFNMSARTASLMIQELVEELNFDPNEERNLTFHSLKARSLNEIYEKTHDIRLMQKQGNHKKIETTLNRYARLSNDPLKNPSLLVGKKVDTSVIQNATPEQLLQAIGMCDEFIKIALSNKLKELGVE